MNFSEKLQKLRKENKLSQEQLANLLDVSRQAVSKWESGATYPEMDKLLAMCKIFHCTLEELTNDEIKEINKEKKASLNIIDELLEAINKTINMFHDMTSQEIFKCFLQLLMVIIVLLVISVPYTYLGNIIRDVFSNLGPVGGFINQLLKSVLNIVYVIFAIIIFFYIYKTRFLDRYTPKKEDEKEIAVNNIPVENLKEDSKSLNKAAKVNLSKEKPSKFLSLLGKILMLFIKGFLLLCLIPVIFGFIFLIAFLVVDILLMFKGIIFIGPILMAIALLLFGYLVIMVLFNFIFDNKNKVKLLFILFIASLVLGGVGIGITVIEASSFEVVENNTLEKVTTDFEVPMQDDFVIENYNQIEYEVDNTSDKVKVVLEYYDIYKEVELKQHGDQTYVDFEQDYWLNNELLQLLLKDLKNRQIRNYDELYKVEVKIITNEENIAQIKENYQTKKDFLEMQNQLINDYEATIEQLNLEIEELTSKLDKTEEDKEQLMTTIEELENRLLQYKELSDSLE